MPLITWQGSQQSSRTPAATENAAPAAQPKTSDRPKRTARSHSDDQI